MVNGICGGETIIRSVYMPGQYDSPVNEKFSLLTETVRRSGVSLLVG